MTNTFASFIKMNRQAKKIAIYDLGNYEVSNPLEKIVAYPKIKSNSFFLLINSIYYFILLLLLLL